MKATHSMKNNTPVRVISETKQSRKQAKKAQKLALTQSRSEKVLSQMVEVD